MKKNALAILFSIWALLFTACNTAHAPSPTTVDTTPTAVATENVPDTDPADNMGDAPVGLIFESFEDIQAFQVASMGSDADFENYMKTANISNKISQNTARKFAVLLSSQQYPAQIGSNSFTDFGGVYYLDRNTLDLTAKTESVRYRFIYYFGEDPEIAFAGAPVISDVDLGIAKLDLYQSDGALVGTYSYQNAVVQVIVYTETPDSVSLDSIVFAPSG